MRALEVVVLHILIDRVPEVRSQAAPIPTTKTLLSAVTLNGKIYAIGGEQIGPNGECWRSFDAIHNRIA